MPKADPPLPRVIAKFVKHHLADKTAFAAFTGQDHSAWNAFVYFVELYGRSDAMGEANAIDAMRSCIEAAQHGNTVVMACFKKAIPGVLDWPVEPKLWVKIAPIVKRAHVTDDKLEGMLEGMLEGPLWPCPDGERICAHLRSKPSKKHADMFDCRDCQATWGVS